MKVLESRLEKDFKLFMKILPKLQPDEFCGLCKVLSVKMYDAPNEEDKVDFKRHMTEEERKEAYKEMAKKYPVKKAEDLIEPIMDKFCELTKVQRRNLLGLLKDCTRGRG